MISYPLTREQICTMSDGAAVAILSDERRAREFTDRPIRIIGVGCGTDTMRLADRPFGKVPLYPWEKASDYADLAYPGVHSFRPGRAAGLEAYRIGRDTPTRSVNSTSSSSTMPTLRARSRRTRTWASADTERGTISWNREPRS